jgi:hypothetical protein
MTDKMATKAGLREGEARIDALVTPSLLLDRSRLVWNIRRPADYLDKLGAWCARI